MKRNILVVAVISGLILLVGLSFQLGRLADTHGSENTLATSNLQVGGEQDPKAAMDPDMPGMDNSDPNVIGEGVDRPLKATLGAFGVATSIVLSGAIILRRRDENQRELKINARKNSGEVR